MLDAWHKTPILFPFNFKGNFLHIASSPVITIENFVQIYHLTYVNELNAFCMYLK